MKTFSFEFLVYFQNIFCSDCFFSVTLNSLTFTMCAVVKTVFCTIAILQIHSKFSKFINIYEMYNAWTTSLAYLSLCSCVSSSTILSQSVQQSCFKKRVREAEISLTQLYQTIHRTHFWIQFLTMIS